MATLARDQNFVPVAGGVSDADGTTILPFSIDAATGRLKVSATVAGGSFAPTDATYVTLSTNATLTNERVLTGTANQIVLTDNGAGSTIVLSLPQSIATSSTPTFASMTLTGASSLTLGTASSATGAIILKNSSNTNNLTIQAGATSGATTLTLPVDDGNNGEVLTTNGSGVLSWTAAGGSGTVTTVSVASANGFAGTVANATTTPAITISTSVTGILSGNGTAVSAASTTGSGAVVLADTPTLITPVLGVATATSINGLTITSSTGTLTITNGKTFAVTHGLTLSGTDSTTMTFPTTTATIARTDAGQTFTGVQVMTSPTITTANLSGTQLLAEGGSIGLDPALSADGTWSGITMTATSGYSQAFGDLVYLDPTDSRWEAVDANAAAAADGDARGNLAMVVVTGTDGNACTLLRSGVIRADAKFPSFTVNNPIYASETAGEVTQTQPSTADAVIRIVGAALTADSMWFNPDNTWITHT